MGITYNEASDSFYVQTSYRNNWMVKSCPDRRWDKKHKVWVVPVTNPNIEHLKTTFRRDAFDGLAWGQIQTRKFEPKPTIPFPAHYPWRDCKYKPYDHQMAALNKAWNQDQFAFFHEMRCAKTSTSLHLCTALVMENIIDAMLVVAPTAIKHVWPRETNTHMPVHCQYDVRVVDPGNVNTSGQWMNKAEEGLQTFRIPIMVVGVEALQSKPRKKYANPPEPVEPGSKTAKVAVAFAERFRCAVIIDESDTIKNWEAKRTEIAHLLGPMAARRYILTGTPVTQGMQDLYSQFAFLDPQIIGMKSYFSFRNRYCVMGGFEGKKIVGYTNVAELMKLIAPYADRVRTKDCFDLPPKVYEERWVEPTPAQKEATRMLKKQHATEHNGKKRTVATELERQLRYQQIAGGHIAHKVDQSDAGTDKPTYQTEPLEGKNPKVEELLRVVEKLPDDEVIIVWARFRPEIAAIGAALDSVGEVMHLTGNTPDSERKIIMRMFDPRTRKDSDPRFLVAVQQVGGAGLELAAATTEIYFSNTFSMRDRVQSEARTQSSLQTQAVLCVDLRVNLPIDKLLKAAIERKVDVADLVSDKLQAGEDIDDAEWE